MVVSGPAAADGAEETIQALVERLETRVESARCSLVVKFAVSMLRRRPHPVGSAADLDAVVDRLVEAFDFFDARRRGELAIRVANPTVPLSENPQPGTVIEISSEDRPFLLTTVIEELRRLGHEVVYVLHPVMGVVRNEEGRLVDVVAARRAKNREALLHLELDRRVPVEEHDELEGSLRSVLEDVIVVVHDGPQMRANVERLASGRARAHRHVAPEEAIEVAALLDWLLDGNFLLLGWREYSLSGDDGELVERRAESGLGMLSDTQSSGRLEPAPLADADDEGSHQTSHEHDAILTFSRNHTLSTIHERARTLNVWVKQVDDTGEVSSQTRLLGLFTEKARAQPPWSTPVIRRKLARILELEDVVEDSHDEHTFVSLFEAVPLEELFELPLPALRHTLVALAAAEERQDLHLVCYASPLTATLTALLSIPADRYDADLRRDIEELLLERFGGTTVDVEVSISERRQPLVRFAVHVSQGPIPTVDVGELEAQVRALSRTWIDELEDALVSRHGESEGRRLLREVGARMPTAYRERTTLDRAVADVEALDELIASSTEFKVLLHDDPRGEGRLTRLKVFKGGSAAELSQILPILESLGLTVTEEMPYALTGEGPELHLHDYGVHNTGQLVEIDRDAQRVAEAVVAAWQGRLEVDSLNRLVLRAGLDARWVSLLRGYRRFRLQVGTIYTAEYQNEVLVNHPQFISALVGLFDARFNPDRLNTDVEAARAPILQALEAVERLDDDRILRSFLALVDATLRTNFYLPDTGGRLALKVASRAVTRMPRPVPHSEIFVYSPEMEGIHLRGGPVARGGIRWSERRDDFRTEVLGLMQAQMLKNALIVPTGAKGGFVLKRLTSDRWELEAEVKRQYETFIQGLLDVTDNVVGGKVQAPVGVRRADGDDPYLVVAPDRGTAWLSDTANQVASERGFWLGDAFASGGSAGYDHKQLGITAHGAWLAVQRHFRELGIDPQRDPITVVAIGDLSGDVFGNSMLRSRAIKLVAAFDHRDIFLDPNPDPQRACTERQRLYGNTSLSWQDYDRAALSSGGGVWSRTEKTIPLSNEVRELLDLEEESLPPPKLIRAILAASVDLLFAAGIGTFVRASHETNEDIGDRANNELRTEATQLRARVYAEGANLSITHPGRIQYARQGGRINADFIDNAAGVNLSDHEVNLKILLGQAIERGLIDADEREELLVEVKDEVVKACLRDVDQQAWVLSQEALSRPGEMDTYEGLMSYLEAASKLDRKLQALPSTEEIAERREAGADLTRPELAVLLATTKRSLSEELVASKLLDQPGLRPALESYFPRRLVQRCRELLDHHRLRRELIAAVLANDVVNHAGITFVHRLARELGAQRPAVVAAWWAARQVARAERYWHAISRIDRDADPGLAMQVKGGVDALLEMLTREYLHSADLETLDAVVTRDREAFNTLAGSLDRRQASHPTPQRSEQRKLLIDAGLEPGLAHELTGLTRLALTPHVASIAHVLGRGPAGVGEAFLLLGEALGLDRLQHLLDSAQPQDQWARWQRRGLLDDLRALHRLATHRALTEHPHATEDEAIHCFLNERHAALDQAARLLREAEKDPHAPRLDPVSVAMRAIRNALDRPP